MRRCLKYVILLLALLSPALVLAQSGQEDEATDRAETRQKPVTFVAIMPEGAHLTDQQKLALQNKVERIIAKNKVGAGAGTTLFGIKADLDVKDTKRSAGLVRDVTVLSAEVTFTAVNTVDGSVYYSQSVSLQTDVVGDKEKAMDQLIGSIRVSDPQIVRFVRTASKCIAKWYEDQQREKEMEMELNTPIESM